MEISKFMKKIFSATMAVFLAISVLFISRGILFAEETTKPVVNTAFYATNYHYFIDIDASFKIYGSGFGDIQGNVINIDKNINLLVQSWSDTSIKMVTINNNGTVSVGPNNLIVRTSDGIDSEQFIVTFEKYWIGPNILSISPAIINLGDQVEIIGENFGDSQPVDCPIIPSNPAVPVQVY
ncbi:hypothetical protein A2Y83_04280 [Candidatus Falkowbacteria bacterium RBG_13_39_14]|uniref:IPT/TIG domain-containing protein n=1 Tax=Candidatus Falkowbacteria bacterium RBG_13_39_14 TaxID=1797985 RepID=A0A1F5S8H6_9BACT|nr:MAG: hypothetical protein A2Y83_04280 [Candidatus Falkowbacteria bacterium RBG_13_39_14]